MVQINGKTRCLGYGLRTGAKGDYGTRVQAIEGNLVLAELSSVCIVVEHLQVDRAATVAGIFDFAFHEYPAVLMLQTAFDHAHGFDVDQGVEGPRREGGASCKDQDRSRAHLDSGRSQVGDSASERLMRRCGLSLTI